MGSSGLPSCEFDAVVVGSGYGGAVAACRLAQAGLNVCVLEKGKAWQAHEFPTSTSSFLRKMKFHTPLGSFGGEDSLWEVLLQKDSISISASGLGGGSLVNAGVFVPTPQRVRSDPRWPPEWQEDWEVHEARRDLVLQPQSVPYEFPQAQMMDKLEFEIEDAIKVPVKLTTRFSTAKNLAGIMQDACVACGNCLTGCPYNAKSSNDKTYIELAAQAGASIHTNKEVLFVLKGTEMTGASSSERRWRVYLNHVDYVSADCVVLAAGVLGTTGILLQSRERGLALSQRLGCGLSCNGNNIALVAGTSAPVQGHAMEPKRFPNTTMSLRPGPSISSLHTSSLGYSVQAATIPKAAPDLVLKGVLTYVWPPGFGLFYGLLDTCKKWIGTYDSQAVAFTLMGYDSGDGTITMNKRTGRLQYLAPVDELLPRKVQTMQRFARRLGGKLFLSRFRSISVHLLGGCNAAVNASLGVTNAKGQVFTSETQQNEIDPNSISMPNTVHEGLYVCDGSVIPCSLGVNPAGTIATVSELIASKIAADATKYSQSRTKNDLQDGFARGSDVIVRETLEGDFEGMPCTMKLIMHMGGRNKDSDTMRSFGDEHRLLRGRVGGQVTISEVESDTLHIVDGTVDMCYVDQRVPFTQFMHYQLLLTTSTGRRFVLNAKKELKPFLGGAWMYQESTTLSAEIHQIPVGPTSVTLRGTFHVTPLNLLKSLVTLRGSRKIEFVRRLVESLMRTYWMGSPRTRFLTENLPKVMKDQNYPQQILHEIVTGDGKLLTCKQWPVGEHQCTRKLVLLLNGYSTESFCLPTEKQDFVRALLGNGYEPWLLQTRLDPSNATEDCFSLDTIAKYDIPSVFAKIKQVKKEAVPVHVVAHCVGGLLIHMAVLGGHVAASCVASLICTNSSMFFSMVPIANVKMALPLLPISMRILGSQQTVSITVKTEEHIAFRHKLIRKIAKMIPRTEGCVCEECNIFSGIFGNAFWHANVSTETHDWVARQTVPVLPMSAFPHLRKICLRGHAVDAQGQNTYMMHPERLAVATTYIYGGKPILVTPEASIRAHEFVKKHHPEFDHACIKIPHYGHSDLWIGEGAYRDVFPCVLDRLRLADDDRPGCNFRNRERNLQKNSPLLQERHQRSAPATRLILIFLILLLIINPKMLGFIQGFI